MATKNNPLSMGLVPPDRPAMPSRPTHSSTAPMPGTPTTLPDVTTSPPAPGSHGRDSAEAALGSGAAKRKGPQPLFRHLPEDVPCVSPAAAVFLERMPVTGAELERQVAELRTIVFGDMADNIRASQQGLTFANFGPSLRPWWPSTSARSYEQQNQPPSAVDTTPTETPVERPLEQTRIGTQIPQSNNQPCSDRQQHPDTPLSHTTTAKGPSPDFQLADNAHDTQQPASLQLKIETLQIELKDRERQLNAASKELSTLTRKQPSMLDTEVFGLRTQLKDLRHEFKTAIDQLSERTLKEQVLEGQLLQVRTEYAKLSSAKNEATEVIARQGQALEQRQANMKQLERRVVEMQQTLTSQRVVCEKSNPVVNNEVTQKQFLQEQNHQRQLSELNGNHVRELKELRNEADRQRAANQSAQVNSHNLQTYINNLKATHEKEIVLNRKETIRSAVGDAKQTAIDVVNQRKDSIVASAQVEWKKASDARQAEFEASFHLSHQQALRKAGEESGRERERGNAYQQQLCKQSALGKELQSQVETLAKENRRLTALVAQNASLSTDFTFLKNQVRAKDAECATERNRWIACESVLVDVKKREDEMRRRRIADEDKQCELNKLRAEEISQLKRALVDRERELERRMNLVDKARENELELSTKHGVVREKLVKDREEMEFEKDQQIKYQTKLIAELAAEKSKLAAELKALADERSELESTRRQEGRDSPRKPDNSTPATSKVARREAVVDIPKKISPRNVASVILEVEKQQRNKNNTVATVRDAVATNPKIPLKSSRGPKHAVNNSTEVAVVKVTSERHNEGDDKMETNEPNRRKNDLRNQEMVGDGADVVGAKDGQYPDRERQDVTGNRGRETKTAGDGSDIGTAEGNRGVADENKRESAVFIRRNNEALNKGGTSSDETDVVIAEGIQLPAYEKHEGEERGLRHIAQERNAKPGKYLGKVAGAQRSAIERRSKTPVNCRTGEPCSPKETATTTGSSRLSSGSVTPAKTSTGLQTRAKQQSRHSFPNFGDVSARRTTDTTPVSSDGQRAPVRALSLGGAQSKGLPDSTFSGPEVGAERGENTHADIIARRRTGSAGFGQGPTKVAQRKQRPRPLNRNSLRRGVSGTKVAEPPNNPGTKRTTWESGDRNHDQARRESTDNAAGPSTERGKRMKLPSNIDTPFGLRATSDHRQVTKLARRSPDRTTSENGSLAQVRTTVREIVGTVRAGGRKIAVAAAGARVSEEDVDLVQKHLNHLKQANDLDPVWVGWMMKEARDHGREDLEETLKKFQDSKK